MVVVDGVPRVADRSVAACLGPFAERGTTVRIGHVERWVNGAGE